MILLTSNQFQKDRIPFSTILKIRRDVISYQNPIKPIDLVSNDDRLHSLVAQCKTNFPQFYFERQTKGFKADKHAKDIIIPKRVLEKNATARSYYA